MPYKGRRAESSEPHRPTLCRRLRAMHRFVMVAPLILRVVAVDARGLEAQGLPEVEINQAWEERVFGQAASEQPSLVLLEEEGPGDTKLGRCAAGGPIRLGDRVYERGIGVNSYSALRLTLAGGADRLLAAIGLDRNVDGTPGSVRFRVRADGTDLLATDVIHAGDAPQSIDIRLGGARLAAGGVPQTTVTSRARPASSACG
ncbi:MAG: hypothetical protein GF320_15480 [Armatimonadia bacterium]|nr:hypothetical protein [Armatimonadia bacterium]